MSGHCTKAGALCESMWTALDVGAGVAAVHALIVPLAFASAEKAGTTIAYQVPGRGKGKTQKPATNLVFTYCPWCGGTLR